jgi:hypothetical protein
MKSIIHIVARFFLLLSIAVAPLNGVQASLLMDMNESPSQSHMHMNDKDMSQKTHGDCDMADKGGCKCDSDCQSGCSACNHCNITGNLSVVTLYQELSGQNVMMMPDLRFGIVLPLENRPPQHS